MNKAGESSIVKKCTQVMDVVSNARRPLAFSDIVAHTGFVKSSAHRILAILLNEELIHYDKNTRTYQTGQRLHDWARLAWRRVDLQEIASGIMHAVSEKTGMNTALSILDRQEILYLRTVDIVQYRFASHAGDHAPLHSTAAGKVFMAHMSEELRNETLGKLSFAKLTENTKTSEKAIMDELQAVRQNGFAKALGEEQFQVTGIAAPIWNAEGKITGCLSLWSLLDHATREEVISEAKALMEATHQISKQLGWSGNNT